MNSISLSSYAQVLPGTGLPVSEGRLLDVVGLVLEAGGCTASIGDVYEIEGQGSASGIRAEVVGLRGKRALLMALGETAGLRVGAALRKVGNANFVAVGPALVGRVVDGLGRAIDGRGPVHFTAHVPLQGAPRNPLLRRPVDTAFPVGVRVIDHLMTLGEGQRIGIFAGGGVGKSSLLGMMVKNAAADIAVIALIGERGREVEDFVRTTLGEEGLARSVVVVATSADPPLLRARASLYAAAIADHFRNRGKKVLFVMDSLTRYAMARREIGLSIGEPPATKGYTPSVFTSLPQLLERAGQGAGSGSVTGVYTVLVEGDDMSDPVADAARAALDGHILLSRELAERGHYPAVDVPSSLSRVMANVASPETQSLALRVRETLATYAEVADLLAVGAYRKGAIPAMDAAIECMPNLNEFLRQGQVDNLGAGDAEAVLRRIFNEEQQPSEQQR